VTVAGVAALRWGVGRSLALFPLFRISGDDEDFPTILWALPFFAFGTACLLVGLVGIDGVKQKPFGSVGIGLAVTGIGFVLLSLLIMIGIGLRRAGGALRKVFRQRRGDVGRPE
jgi:hypothetical protein